MFALSTEGERANANIKLSTSITHLDYHLECTVYNDVTTNVSAVFKLIHL